MRKLSFAYRKKNESLAKSQVRDDGAELGEGEHPEDTRAAPETLAEPSLVLVGRFD